MADKKPAKTQKAEVTRREQEAQTFVPPADIWEAEERVVTDDHQAGLPELQPAACCRSFRETIYEGRKDEWGADDPHC